MAITRHTIEEVKSRVPIEEVVGAHVLLKRRGKSLVGLSPFSNEKTPSFYVYPEKGFYYCFSTSQGGDVISFVSKVENLPFYEAVESLANRFSIPIEYDQSRGNSPEERSLRRQLLEIHEQAAEFYHQRFMAESKGESKGIRHYWSVERGFSEEVAQTFKIGYAPAHGNDLQAHLSNCGFSMQALRDCGLFYASESATTPRHLRARFRGRLMVPIRDVQGQIVAFTARKTGATPTDDPTVEAKYVNSPETEIFHKSNLVFNLDRARTAVGENSPFVLVEGQLDAIRCWTTGVTSAIAFQGSAITERQVQLLRRYHDRLLCLFDGDVAGTKAGMAVLPLALQCGMAIEFIQLPMGCDPDALLRERGLSGFSELQQSRLTAVQYALQVLLPESDPSPRDIQNALWKLFPMLVTCDSAIVRDAFLAEAITRVKAEPNAVREDFRRFLRRGGLAPERSALRTPESEARERLTSAESHLLFLLLHHDRAAEEIIKVIDIEWINHSITEGIILGRIMAESREGNWNGTTDVEAFLQDEEERNCVYAILAQELSFDNPVQEINKCLERIFRNHLIRRLQTIDSALRELPDEAPERRALRVERAALNRSRLVTPPPRLLVDELAKAQST